MEGSCSGCPSSAVTLKLAIEEAIHKAAPEIEEIEAEDAVAARAADGLREPPLIELAPLAPRENGAGAWATAGVLPQLRAGGTVLKEVAGEPVLFCEVDGTPYAYRPTCPGCGESLEEAELRGAELRLPELRSPLRRAAGGPMYWTRRRSTSSPCRCSSTTRDS